jgi:hypothetical protein
MSMDASGTIASAITFSRWKGIPYVRRHAIPNNPRSGKQVGFRSMLGFLANQWTLFSAPDKATWEALADAMHQSGFNRFVGVNQTRWSQFRAPSSEYPAPETPATISAATITGTGGVREASLSIADGATAPDWGYLIFGLLAGAPTPSLSNLVGVAPWVSDPTIFIHTPIGAGVWHYKSIGFNITGLKGIVSADATATVT